MNVTISSNTGIGTGAPPLDIAGTHRPLGGGWAFKLEAYQDGVLQNQFQFADPASVELHYS